MRTIIETHGRIGFLNKVRRLGNSDTGLPSWVFNRDALLPGPPLLMTPAVFSASKDLAGTWEFTQGRKVFVIKGRLIDVVDSAGLPFPERNYYVDTGSQLFTNLEAKDLQMIGDYLNSAAELARSCTMPRDTTPTTQVVYTCSRESFRTNEDFEILRLAKMLDPFKVLRNSTEYMRLYLQAWEKVEAAEKSSRPPPRGSWTRPLWLWTHLPKQMWAMDKNFELERLLTPLRNLFIENLLANCIVKTQGGFLANIPQTYQVGDLVVILYGWRTPFLLRPSPQGLLLIGECYVYGIMHGEAIDYDIGDETDFELV